MTTKKNVFFSGACSIVQASAKNVSSKFFEESSVKASSALDNLMKQGWIFQTCKRYCAVLASQDEMYLLP